jgi:hypothetical protein
MEFTLLAQHSILRNGSAWLHNPAMAFDPTIVCERIAAGESMRQIATSLGLSAGAIPQRAATDPAFAERYARAMEIRADVHAERIEELAERTEAGDIDPQAARVAIDARKWTAAKLRPKRYGDRIQQDVDATVRVVVDDPTKR